MNLYSESNGTSARRGSASRVSSASTPIFAASTTNAASVGSPMTAPSSPTVASVHSTRPSARRRKSGRLAAAHAEDRAGLLVAGALDLEPVTAGQHRGRGHRVHGQRAGLVAVDDRRPAQGLDVGERLDHRLGLGQMPRSRRQHRLHEGRQAGRDRRDRRRDAQQQEGVVSCPRAMPKTAITATASQATRPNTLVMPSSSRCSGERVRLVAGDHVGDLAHLGRLTGRGHHERRRAAGDLRVLEHQVGPVAQRDLARRAAWPRSLRTGALSPVSAASWTSRVAEDRIRPSAGTTSPASSSTMSPGHQARSTRPPRPRRIAAPGRAAPGAGPAPRRWPAP